MGERLLPRAWALMQGYSQKKITLIATVNYQWIGKWE